MNHAPVNQEGHAKLPATPTAAMMLGALGVVYGDIGTSPLYTIKAALAQLNNPGEAEVLGLLSLLFWMLMMVVSLKYMIIMLRSDNRGEGGTLALMELALRGVTGPRRWRLIVLGLIGACLFYGDSMVTPAISVLSAMEGIELISPALERWVVPLAIVVLAGLFMIQSRGTGAVGKLFGPVMLVWFLTLGGLGAWRIALEPGVLRAINPMWAFAFIANAPWEIFLLLGAIVLALTGAETIYADMGHFGRSAIRRVWFAAVLPALVLCYFGQGAVILADPLTAKNPFFHLAPGWALVPLVGLATMATIIASQSVISGAFSVTRQAVQLGFWPRMVILHTSAREEGQIYLPRVNILLFIAVLVLVLAFRTSEGLAHAYGFAVTGTMLMTSLLAFAVVPRYAHGSRRWLWLCLISVFLVIDVLLFSSNTLKIHDGGWVPLLVGACLLTLMITWKQGRQTMHDKLAGDQQPLKTFMEGLEEYPPTRVPGTAVFMSMIVNTVPPALLHNLKHNKILHEQAIFLTVESADVPYVPASERYQLERLSRSGWQAVARWGFKQEPNVPQVLEQIAEAHPELNLDPMQTSYFLSRQTVIVRRTLPWYTAWRRYLFAFMARNASRSTRFYRIPPNRVVEMGMQMEL
ncbi:potassium transporter Kup [Pollutimonas subterranea]|uniref:Probable potassium transport system protein Kup n=1 Tax=Pollutimonas subterranea TaxID=2045210 RepID=A0A2N4U3P5_9BURK|nr:potassium transporter Kup [Pollutimonas subterranea]PLC49629.1 potassium transporter Kup [Pollutimonas subterranea]